MLHVTYVTQSAKASTEPRVTTVPLPDSGRAHPKKFLEVLLEKAPFSSKGLIPQEKLVVLISLLTFPFSF
jgi:hypothetical protein